MKRGGKILAGVTIAALVGCTGETGKLEIRSTAVPPSAVAKPVPLRVAEGRGQLALGNVALALESFRKASREDPGSTDALLGVATCYDRMGRYDLSRRSYEAALAIAPADTQVLAAFASSLELQGLTQQALKVRQEIAARNAPLVAPKALVAAAPVKVAAAAAKPAPPKAAAPKPLHPAAAAPVVAPPPAVATEPVSAAAPMPAAPRPVKVAEGPRAVAPAPVKIAEAPRTVAPTPVAVARTAPAVEPVAARKAMQPVRPAEAAPLSRPAPAAKPAPVAAPTPAPVPVAVAAATVPSGPSVTIKLPAPRPLAEAPAEPDTPKPEAVKHEAPKPAPATPEPAAPQALAGVGPRLERISMAEIALVTTPAPLWRPTTVAQSGTTTTVRFVPLRQASAQPTRVRLLNAARVNRLAARTRGWLVARGWRGLAIGNARSTRERSVVLYPVGKRALAQRMSAQFGFAIAERAYGSDIIVLLGRDAARVPALKPANV